MPRRSDAKMQMVRSAAELFQRQGYHGTGMAEILERSGAPKGSVYHHFPGGKEELALHAVKLAGDEIRQMVHHCVTSTGSFEGAVQCLSKKLSDWFDSATDGAGCPIAAVLLDTSGTSTDLREQCGAVFNGWSEEMSAAAVKWGFSEENAAKIGETVVMTMEGAWILARASNSSAPFKAAAEVSAAYARSHA